MLEITAGGFSFAARFEDDAAPETVAAFRRMLPLDSQIIHVRWSGEGGWIPMGDLDVGIGPENATSYPSPGELIFYPGGVSETELLLAYGYVAFASKAGAARGEPLRDDRLGQREPARARAPNALGRRPGHLVQGAVGARLASPVRRSRAPARTSTASSTSSSEESSSGEWLTPPLRLRTNSIPESTAAAARMPASWPAPDASSTTGSPRASISARSASRQSSLSATGSVRCAGVEADRPTRELRDARASGARASTREAHARGNDVSGAWLDVELPDSRNRAGNRSSCIPDLEYPPRRRDQCVVATVHRRRPRMPSASLEHELCSRVADDPGDDSERHVALGRGPDPARREARGKRAGSGPPAATSARLPMQPTSSPRNATTEPAPTRSTASIAATTPSAPSNRPPCGTVSRCEPTQQASGTFSPRAPPRACPKRLPCASTSTSQTGLLEPRRRERVRLVLGRRGMRPIRTRPTADRVELVEPVEDAHARSVEPRRRYRPSA